MTWKAHRIQHTEKAVQVCMHDALLATEDSQCACSDILGKSQWPLSGVVKPVTIACKLQQHS